jgi:hypothetical protein
MEDNNKLEQLKEDYLNFLSNKVKQLPQQLQKPNDKIKLFHGTTLKYLNSILVNGLLPRKSLNVNNWEERPSHEEVCYLTNKWHYFYADQSTTMYMKNNFEENNHRWWENYETFPCYVELSIPRELLVADEDFIGTTYMIHKLNKFMQKNQEIKWNELISWEESLANYGTVGILGSIKPENLISFTIIADIEWFYRYINSSGSQYHKDYLKWQGGKGKGKLKFMELLELEDKSSKIATWWMKDIPKNSLIHSFTWDPEKNKILLKFNEIIYENKK